MKKLNRMVALSILAALVLALVAIIPASADPPERAKIPLEWDDTIYECGVELTVHETVWFQTREWCPQEDDRCGYTEHWFQERRTITNPSNGRALTFRGSALYRVEWITWYDSIYESTGLLDMATIPGVGPVYGSVGRTVVYEACQGDYPDNWVCEYETLHDSATYFDDIDAICNYLLGE